MALSAPITLSRRGQRAGRSDFGYPAAPGVTIYAGGVMGLNASGQIQPIQTAAGTVAGVTQTACVAFAGIAMSTYVGLGVATVGPLVVASRESYALTVPSATYANIGAPVYAIDDGTLTLTQPTTGFTGPIGTLVGIENGQTYVLIEGA
jgi:hypothetical protein